MIPPAFKFSPVTRPIITVIFFVFGMAAPLAVGADDPISFNRDIRPILSDKCFHCHGPDEHSREADLRFDIKESAMHAIEPGDPDSSELIYRILEEDPDSRMPPAEVNKPLTPAEVQLLQKWIEQGAQWSDFWAYVAPVKHEVPSSKLYSSAKKSNWIDHLVGARLESLNLSPSKRADRTTLIRRLYFDLIGLPPTPTQVRSFVSDKSVNAFEKVVDELLDSPHFGERMAIYWLDLVRYADTVGYHGDQDHNISPYRDWVINSFNENMRFDQFTREQLAGDLLPNPTTAQQVASGYNRLLQTTHEGGLQPKEYSAIYAADRVRNVSGVWMGATVGCAQCHDHKFDPYTAKDFYSLAAFFADIDDEKHFKSGTNKLPTRRDPELLLISDSDRKELEIAQKTVNQTQAKVTALKKKIAAKDKDKAASSAKDVAAWKLELKNLEQALSKSRSLGKAIEQRGRWTMITRTLDSPRTVRVLSRGDWMDESGEIVLPAVPEFLGSVAPDEAVENKGNDEGAKNEGAKNEGAKNEGAKARRATRLDLANWLVDGQQDSGKLTARVFANRVWHLLMGIGVSKSLDDFGGQGEAPVDLKLLDNLAIEFIETGWDVKALVRQIVTSQTYQQSSLESKELREIDPFNQTFARQSRFRLPAEVIRDNALAIGGLLVTDEIGGRSVRPYQPSGYYQHLNFPQRKYSHDKERSQWRRGVYVHWQRQFLHPTLKALDAPSREECTAQRAKSNTPSAALALLNDPSFIEAARAFAERVLKETKTTAFDDRLEMAFELALSRPPTSAESQLLNSLLEQNLEQFNAAPEDAKSLTTIGQQPVDQDINPAELAAWTMVTRAILNTSESMSRN